MHDDRALLGTAVSASTLQHRTMRAAHPSARGASRHEPHMSRRHPTTAHRSRSPARRLDAFPSLGSAPRPIALVIEAPGGSARQIRLERERDGYYSVAVRGVRAGDRYRYRLDGELSPIRRRGFSRMARSVRRRSSIPARYQWSDGVAWRGVSRGQVRLRDARRHVYSRRHVARGDGAAARALARLGITRHRDDAGRRVPGAVRMGLRRRVPLRADASLRDARRFPGVRRPRARARARRDPRRRLQPPRSRRLRVRRVRTPTTSPSATRTSGATRSISMGPIAAPVARVFRGQRRVLDRRVPPRRAAARRDAEHPRRSAEHILAVIAATRARGGRGTRSIMLVAENEPQDVRLVRPVRERRLRPRRTVERRLSPQRRRRADRAARGVLLAITAAAPQELDVGSQVRVSVPGAAIRVAEAGARHAGRDGLPPAAFVNFLENHDQVANSGDGSRLHQRTSPGTLSRHDRAAAAACRRRRCCSRDRSSGRSTPFLYFADHKPELAAAVPEGARANSSRSFRASRSPEMQARLPRPHDPATFERCKLRWDGTRRTREHATAARGSDRDCGATMRRSAAAAGRVDGAVLGPEGVRAALFAAEARTTSGCCIVNLGLRPRAPASFAEPLMAPPDGHQWKLALVERSIRNMAAPARRTCRRDAGWRDSRAQSAVGAAAELENADERC